MADRNACLERAREDGFFCGGTETTKRRDVLLFYYYYYYYYCSFVLSCCVPAGRLGLGGGWCYWIGNLICARISINLLRPLFPNVLIRIDCIWISAFMIDNCSSSLGSLRAKLVVSHISYCRRSWVPTEERGCWATVVFK